MKILTLIEKVVVLFLLVLMLVVVLASTAEVAVIIFQGLTNETPLRLDLAEVLPVLGGLMLVLIGIELLHTVKIYFEERQLHVEVVVLVALIAIARKVIIIDYKQMDGPMLLGLAALFLSLSGGYYLLAKAQPACREPSGH